MKIESNSEITLYDYYELVLELFEWIGIDHKDIMIMNSMYIGKELVTPILTKFNQHNCQDIKHYSHFKVDKQY